MNALTGFGIAPGALEADAFLELDPQSRKVLSAKLRVRMTQAASCGRFATDDRRAWRCARCSPPGLDWYRHLVRPSQTPTDRDVRKWAGSSTAVAKG